MFQCQNRESQKLVPRRNFEPPSKFQCNRVVKFHITEDIPNNVGHLINSYTSSWVSSQITGLEILMCANRPLDLKDSGTDCKRYNWRVVLLCGLIENRGDDFIDQYVNQARRVFSSEAKCSGWSKIFTNFEQNWGNCSWSLLE